MSGARCQFREDPFTRKDSGGQCSAGATHNLKGIGEYCAEHGTAMRDAVLRLTGKKVPLKVLGAAPSSKKRAPRLRIED